MTADLYQRTASNPFSVTEYGARLFGVSTEQFSNWRWQMKHQVQSPQDVENILTLSADEKEAFVKLHAKFHAGVTPYAMSLIDFKNKNDPIRLQLLPSMVELDDADGVPDPLCEVPNSPVKEVVHVYPDRVAWCVAQLCPIYCRYCFRKRRDEETGLHFNPKILEAGLAYIASNKNIKDVLVTGGDPFIAQDGAIEGLLKKLREIPHVEIIRFGTRTPVYLPYRITQEFAQMLSQYHPIWVNTHFNCAQELTPQAAESIDLLLRAGIPVGNQSVFLKGVNDSKEKMLDLVRGLVRIRLRPYYIFHPQLVEGTAHLRIPIEQGLDIMKSLQGQVTGFAIPKYILDTPSGKVPLSYPNILGRDGDVVIVEQTNGKPWREQNPLGDYVSVRGL